MRYFITYVALFLSISLSAQLHPKREFRGAWIQTVFQSEYATMTSEEMKVDFIRKLNILQECGINALIFQIRPEADAWYSSTIEPWSRFLTGEQGVAPDPFFDPMEFLIKECHKRNIEFHAWLNPYRAGTSGTSNLCQTHIYHQYPEWFVLYNNQLLFDPGMPECRDHICKVVKDITTRYDIDAIHMDDYFYPYPTGAPFPDKYSYDIYGKGKNIADWRRDNVNKLIRDLKRTIIEVKPWVRFGISPFGIYRNKKSDPNGSETNGLQNYDDLYADILLWSEKKWIDYNMPQLYWEIGHSAADYTTLALWWNKNANNIPLYFGQDVVRTMNANELSLKLKIERSLKSVSGHCFWPANEIFNNTNGIADTLRSQHHRYPALIPAYVHMYAGTPKKVRSTTVKAYASGYRLRWAVKDNPNDPGSAHYFVIYRFAKGERIDLDDPSKIIMTTHYTECHLKKSALKKGDRIVVTAVDRFHNESKGKRKKVKK